MKGNILRSDYPLFGMVGEFSSEAIQVLLFSETLERWLKIIFSCGVLLDLTQVAVGWGHMQMKWSMYRTERQWKRIMQGWIIVDTWAAEALWMNKSLKCIKVGPGL